MSLEQGWPSQHRVLGEQCPMLQQLTGAHKSLSKTSPSHTRIRAEVSALGHGMSLGSQSSWILHSPCAVPWKGVLAEGMEPSNTFSALIPTAAQLWHLATALLLQPSGTASQLPPGQATIPLGRGGEEGKKKGRKKMNPHKNVFITGNVS